ncbi:SDR family NAD(P)-dependent oxidoreductase [Microbacterium sp. 18062]|uniref:SDR family NAD(P)-dependent oxidoreductase n=1 Tax=Microbacterium sp. 18062 TaxID=2681410 RepID=UPI0013587BB2|nr:SDR family NAD(P)-dependent oxidoreductase [Microbacterium sp. 18062]
MEKLLTGRRVLVTGAASGIGLAYARSSAREGADLVLVDRDDVRLEEQAVALREHGATVETFVCDIADAEQVDRVWAEIDEGGAVDGAFLNAGVNGTAPIRTVEGELDHASRELWHRVIGINLDGFFFTLQRTAALMKPRGRGQIVVTGSTSGIRAEPLIGYAYVASKAAVHAVARQASLELAKYGIRINVIAPGSFRTNIAGPAPAPPEKAAVWNAGIPLGRHGEPPELEALAALLISDRSSFMTGGVYVVDGGASVLTQVTMEGMQVS